MAEKKRLGKGLGALIPQEVFLGISEEKPLNKVEVKESEEKPRGKMVREIAVEAIEPNPNQPRKDFDPDELNELANSIREHGIIQPLLVKRENDGFILIAGERRLRAAIIAGLKTVPAIEGEGKTAEKELLVALIENLQRVDLSPIEEARAFNELRDKYNLTQEGIADTVGKSRPYVTNALRLLKLPPVIQKMLAKGEIQTGHAKVLLEAVENEALILSLAEEVKSKDLSVSVLSKKMKAMLSAPKQKRVHLELNPDIRRILENLERRLGVSLSLKLHSREKGEITLHYRSLQELETILTQLRK